MKKEEHNAATASKSEIKYNENKQSSIIVIEQTIQQIDKEQLQGAIPKKYIVK